MKVNINDDIYSVDDAIHMTRVTTGECPKALAIVRRSNGILLLLSKAAGKKSD
jgi:hypothetical protein